MQPNGTYIDKRPLTLHHPQSLALYFVQLPTYLITAHVRMLRVQDLSRKYLLHLHACLAGLHITS